MKQGYSEAYVKVIVVVVLLFFFFKIFINIDKERIRRGGLAQFWSYEKLPVKWGGTGGREPRRIGGGRGTGGGRGKGGKREF